MCFDIGSRHLGCWGQNTSRIQNKEVYATLLLQATAIVSVTATVLVVNFVAEYLPAGIYTVKIQNGPDCVTYAPASITLRVHPKLFALFVDPIIVYNGIKTDAAIFSSGLLSQAKEIEFTNGGKSVKFDNTTSKYIQTPTSSRMSATLPAGTYPPVGLLLPLVWPFPLRKGYMRAAWR